VAVRLTTAEEQYQGGALPLKEGLARPVSTRADRSAGAAKVFTGDVETTGMRGVYVLMRGEGTPVFRSRSGADAIAVFDSRELAVLYLQVAGWPDYTVDEVPALQLGPWLQQLRGHGIREVLVDPNCHDQQNGTDDSGCIDLQGIRDFSGENVLRELLAVAKA